VSAISEISIDIVTGVTTMLSISTKIFSETNAEIPKKLSNKEKKKR